MICRMRVAPVSKTSQSHLLKASVRVKRGNNTVLFRRGEPAFGIFLIKSGTVALQLEAEDGRILWDRLATKGSIIGLPGTLAGNRYSLTAVTKEESEFGFMHRDALITLIKDDSAVGLELMRALGEEVLQIRGRLGSTPLRAAPVVNGRKS